jgi:membrane protein involved in colicin uptake
MATGQASSVYGMGLSRPFRTPYSQQIKSAYGQATADVVARKKAEQEQEALQFDQKVATDELALAKKAYEQNKVYQNSALNLKAAQNKAEADAAKRAMGMNIGTLGYNIANSSAGKDALKFGMNKVPGGLNLTGGSGINLGSLAGAGLAGYGAYQAMGGGTKGALAGVGTGLVTDAISGGGLTSALMKGVTKIPGVGDAVGKGMGFLTDALDWIF